ncbi:hypothetical protein OF83DRAFT_1035347, partial [Amylostereum chailletii]
WDSIRPALDHVMRREPQAPAHPYPPSDLTPASYVSLYTSFHRYMVRPTLPRNQAPDRTFDVFAASMRCGQQAYDALDAFFASKASEILLGAPSHDGDSAGLGLILYLLSAYAKYASGARVVDHLLNWISRRWIQSDVIAMERWRRPLYDARGASALTPTLAAYAAVECAAGPGESKERSRARVEVSAETTSAPERIVSLYSLAMRRFRMEVLEPLSTEPPGGEAADGEQGRLGDAVRVMLETGTIADEERGRRVKELENVMHSVDFPPDHPLRRAL